MTDIVDQATRSRMMSGIRNRDTRPELLVRRGLHAAGFRFRVSDRRLPGKPDLVLPAYSSVIFVHGCFWHQHNCSLFKWPSTRPDWWREKLGGNRARDQKHRRQLYQAGWYVMVVWECALKGPGRRPLEDVIDELSQWLQHSDRNGQIRGRKIRRGKRVKKTG